MARTLARSLPAPLGIALALAACGAPAPTSRSTVANHAAPIPTSWLVPAALDRLGAHAALCAPTPRDADGCRAECVAPPVPWTGATSTFPHLEQWAKRRVCEPPEPVPSTTCGFALEYAGVWYSTPGISCRRPSMGFELTGMRVRKATAQAIDARAPDDLVLAYALEGQVHSIDPLPDGNHEGHDSSRVIDYLVLCGVGPSEIPSCTPPLKISDLDPSLQPEPIALDWKLDHGAFVTRADDPAFADLEYEPAQAGAAPIAFP